MDQIIISSDRLRLKSITPAIIHHLFNTKETQEIKAYLGVDEAQYDRYKKMHEQGMETHRLSLFFFLVMDKETDLPIGECGFHSWNTTHNRAELFYVLNNDADKRKRYISEILPLVIDYGFNQLKIHRIEAFVANWNTPSVKLLNRFGFTKEGTAREHFCVDGKNEDSDSYSLLKWEWKV